MQFILVQKKGTSRRVALAAALTGGVALGALAAGGPAEAQQTPTGQQVTPQQTRAQAARAREAQRGQQPAAAPAGAVQLDTIDVQGQRFNAQIGQPPAPFAGGQVASGARIGVLGNQNVLNSPVSVQSYTDQLRQSLIARTTSDVLTLEPSLQLGQRGPNSQNDIGYARGFLFIGNAVSVNGLPNMSQRSVPIEVMERIEYLRGASAMINGRPGNVGGYINYVTKRPVDYLNSITLGYESSAFFGAHIDVSRRFGPTKEWGIRANLGLSGGGTFFDNHKSRVGFGSLALDYTGDRLRVSLDYIYDNRKNQPGYVPYTYLDGATIVPRAPRKSWVQTWAQYERQLHVGLAQAEFDVLPNVTLFARGGLLFDRETNFGQDYALANNNGLLRYDGAGAQKTEVPRYTIDFGARATLSIGPVRHNITVGYLAGSNAINAANPLNEPSAVICDSNLYQPRFCPRPIFDGAYGRVTRRNQSIFSTLYASNEMSALDDRLIVTLGGSYINIEDKRFNASTGTTILPKYNASAFTPFVGVVAKPFKQLSVFANYVEGLESGGIAPVNAVNAGTILPAAQTRQIEVGARYDFGGFVASLSGFRIQRPTAFRDPVSRIFALAGEQVSTGVELSVFGEPIEGLRLLGGLSYLTPKLTKTPGGINDGKDAIGVARFTARLYAEWDVPMLRGLTLTAGAFHTGDRFYDTANQIKVSGHTRFDVGARYTFKSSSAEWTARLAVENVFDKPYGCQIAGRSI